jgi:hypothetical protein
MLSAIAKPFGKLLFSSQLEMGKSANAKKTPQIKGTNKKAPSRKIKDPKKTMSSV